jgi:hypothetical protein
MCCQAPTRAARSLVDKASLSLGPVYAKVDCKDCLCIIPLPTD